MQCKRKFEPVLTDYRKVLLIFLSTTRTTKTTTTTNPLMIGWNNNFVDRQNSITNNNSYGVFRFASTLIYLLIEAIAVSCLIFALRRERPKFVVPEMAVILVCMSFELILSILVIVAASFGSESLTQILVRAMQEQGVSMNDDEIDQLRRLMPFFLAALAFSLMLGAAFEFWFFRVLRGYYNYLRDKLAFKRGFDRVLLDMPRPGQGHQGPGQGHTGPMGTAAGYDNGYEPMMEESGSDEMSGAGGKNDLPPAYREIVRQEKNEEEETPPSYKEFA